MDPLTGVMIGIFVGGISGIAGVAGYGTEYENYLDDLDAAEEEAARKRRQALETLATEFDVAKKDAERQAARSDWQSTQNEGFVSEDFNNQINAIAAGQESEAFSFNQQAAAIGQNKGNQLSQMAASNTRSSSMQTAVDLEAATNAYALQLTEDNARVNDAINVTSLLNNFMKNKSGIQLDRWAANDLRNDYKAGGGKYRIYQQQVKNINSDYEAAMKEYERQRQQAKDNYAVGAMSAFFGGFGSGFNFGVNSYNWASDDVDFTQLGSTLKENNQMNLTYNNAGRYARTY